MKHLNILVIGASSGIGYQTALKMSNQGHKVIAASRQADKLEKLFSTDANILCTAIDISAEKDCDAVFQLCREQCIHLDVIVNTSGVHAQSRSFHDLQIEDYERILSTNTIGAFALFKSADRYFKSLNKTGHVIQISSAAGSRASVLAGSAYTASKHAFEGMIKTINKEKNINIKISMISPSPTNTPLVETRTIPATQAEKEAMVQPNIIADAILHLCALPQNVYVENMVILPCGY